FHKWIPNEAYRIEERFPFVGNLSSLRAPFTDPVAQMKSVCGFVAHCYSAMSMFLRESLQMLVALFPFFEECIPNEPQRIESRFPFVRHLGLLCAPVIDPVPQLKSVGRLVVFWYSAMSVFLRESLQMPITLFPLFKKWIPNESKRIESRFPFGRHL